MYYKIYLYLYYKIYLYLYIAHYCITSMIYNVNTVYPLCSFFPKVQQESRYVPDPSSPWASLAKKNKMVIYGLACLRKRFTVDNVKQRLLAVQTWKSSSSSSWFGESRADSAWRSCTDARPSISVR